MLSGTTAFGFVHVITEYFTMLSFSDANWDTPPGYGYLIFAAITISAILTVIMALRAPKSGADDEPHQDHRSRPYDAADPFKITGSRSSTSTEHDHKSS